MPTVEGGKKIVAGAHSYAEVALHRGLHTEGLHVAHSKTTTNLRVSLNYLKIFLRNSRSVLFP